MNYHVWVDRYLHYAALPADRLQPVPSPKGTNCIPVVLTVRGGVTTQDEGTTPLAGSTLLGYYYGTVEDLQPLPRTLRGGT